MKQGCGHTNPSSSVPADTWVTHFKSLMNTDHDRGPGTPSGLGKVTTDHQVVSCEILNETITHDEVISAAKSLKNNKACGIDNVCNEMISLSIPVLADVFVNIFNDILISGVFQEKWRYNLITPIHKGGCTTDPANYRGIAISSVFSKFFCRVIHTRLDNYLYENAIIVREQIGFQRNCRTSDHILTLKTLINKALNSSQRLYVCFVDFKKAFDMVNRQSLFHILYRYGIEGPFLNIIINMYMDVRFSVKLEGGITESFSSSSGVKQGCILSPSLFSLYINDMCKYFDTSCDAVTLGHNPISCLMYAADLVMISKSMSGLQSCINKLAQFCEVRDLTINTDKTKVIVFNKAGRHLKSCMFQYNDQHIEVIREYKYFGILFNARGLAKQSIHALRKKALKVLFCMKKAITSEYSRPPLYIKLFDAYVKPVLLYSSEVWGPDYLVDENKCLEALYEKFIPDTLHIKFLKQILGVHDKATNNAVRGEVGAYPVAIKSLLSSVKYWLYVLKKNNSIVHEAYLDSINIAGGFGHQIKTLLHKLGFSHVWENQNTFSEKKLVRAIKAKLESRFDNFWNRSLYDDIGKPNGNKLRTYRTFKKSFCIEKYLYCNDCKFYDVCRFTQLRVSAHKLDIERGRYTRVPLLSRICKMCKGEIEDEVHFVTSCPKLSESRSILYKEISDIVPSFATLDNRSQFEFIVTSNDHDINTICINGISALFNARSMYLDHG